MLQVNPRDLNGSGVLWIKSSQTLYVLRHRQQLKVAGVATVKLKYLQCTNTAIMWSYICASILSTWWDIISSFWELLHAHTLYLVEKLLSCKENKSSLNAPDPWTLIQSACLALNISALCALRFACQLTQLDMLKVDVRIDARKCWREL